MAVCLCNDIIKGCKSLVYEVRNQLFMSQCFDWLSSAPRTSALVQELISLESVPRSHSPCV